MTEVVTCTRAANTVGQSLEGSPRISQAPAWQIMCALWQAGLLILALLSATTSFAVGRFGLSARTVQGEYTVRTT